MKNTVVVAVALAVAVAAQAAPKTKKVIVALNDNVTNVTITNESGSAVRKAKAPAKKQVVAKKAPAKSSKFLQPKTSADKVPVPSTTQASKAAQPLAPTSQAGHLTPVQSVKASASDVKKVAKKSPFSFKYRSYNAMDMDVVENKNPNGDREIRAWDRFGLSYSFNDDISFTLEPEVLHTWFGDRDRAQDPSKEGLEQSYAGRMSDTHLILADSQIARLKGGLVLDGSLRYDIPTSELAQRNGELGQTRVTVGLGREFGAFEAKLTLIGRNYLNQYNTSELKTVPAKKGDPSLNVLNKEFRLYSLVDLTYNFTKKLGFTLEGGFMNTTVHGDEATNRPASRVDQIVMNPELDYAFSDSFALAVGLYEEPSMASLPDGGYVPLSVANNGEAYFMTTVKF
jgi:hypothetical protein